MVSRERSKGGERVLIDSIALVTSTKPSKKTTQFILIKEEKRGRKGERGKKGRRKG